MNDIATKPSPPTTQESLARTLPVVKTNQDLEPLAVFSFPLLPSVEFFTEAKEGNEVMTAQHTHSISSSASPRLCVRISNGEVSFMGGM
jgi:hypothetical protein